MKRPDLSVKRPEQPLKAHQIRSADVVDFLKDSAVKQPLYHNTSTRAKEVLFTAGADFEKSATAAYGRGFYLATAPIKRYGPAEIRVAVDLRSPLDVDLDEFDLRMKDWGVDPGDPDAVRRAILAHGHDGLILRRADLDHRNNFVDFVVVLLSHTIRIIVD
jgi:hypothetical protein